MTRFAPGRRAQSGVAKLNSISGPSVKEARRVVTLPHDSSAQLDTSPKSASHDRSRKKDCGSLVNTMRSTSESVLAAPRAYEPTRRRPTISACEDAHASSFV